MHLKLKVKQRLYYICTTLSQYFLFSKKLYSQTEGINTTTTKVTQEGGYSGIRSVKNGRVNDQRRQKPSRYHSGANVDTKTWKCIYCEVDTFETKERKMLKARELSNEYLRKKKSSSAYGASHSKEPGDEQQENVEDGFSAPQCYAISSVFDWFADSGATASMTDQPKLLMDYENIKPVTWSVSGTGGTNLSVYGRRNVPIITEVKHNNYPINNNEIYIYTYIFI